MSSEKNLQKVHIFSTETKYNDNKNSLDTTEELAIIPAPNFIQYINHSGVSKRADEYKTLNGLGFVIQRGTYPREGGTLTITFPTPFASGRSYVFLLTNDSDSVAPFPATDITSTRSGTFIKIDTIDTRDTLEGIPVGSGKQAEWFAIGRK